MHMCNWCYLAGGKLGRGNGRNTRRLAQASQVVSPYGAKFDGRAGTLHRAWNGRLWVGRLVWDSMGSLEASVNAYFASTVTAPELPPHLSALL